MFNEPGREVLPSGHFILQGSVLEGTEGSGHFSRTNFLKMTTTILARMGTKLEYAFNLLTTSQNSSSISSLHCVDDLEYMQTGGLNKNLGVSERDKFCSSMARMPDNYNIDFIKKTMQLHEDIFKQQVRELHRLHSVQKMLMDELKKESKQDSKYCSPMTSSDINCSQFITRSNSTAQTSFGYALHIQNLRDDPNSRERSGSCSGETERMTRGFDLERPADQEDISTVISVMDDNQAGPSTYAPQKRNRTSIIDRGSDEDSEVELTLSIGGSTSKKISKNYQAVLELDSPASFKSEPDRGEDCSSTPTTPMSSSSATFDQDRKRPHWLFQSLSINRT